MALAETQISSKYFSKVQKVVHLFLYSANDNSCQFDPKKTLSCKLIFRTEEEELKWIYSTFTQLPYKFQKHSIPTKLQQRKNRAFLQWLVTAVPEGQEISRLEDYLLCFDTSTTAGTHETRKAGSLQQEWSEGHKICETGMQQSRQLMKKWEAKEDGLT